MTAVHFAPFDVIRFPSGINRELTDGVILDMHVYDSGGVSLRWRYAGNRHRGIDWHGFISPAEVSGVVVLDHDETVNTSPRSMLPPV
jgi:hypothetical protein